jgi:hypothetical protein
MPAEDLPNLRKERRIIFEKGKITDLDKLEVRETEVKLLRPVSERFEVKISDGSGP